MHTQDLADAALDAHWSHLDATVVRDTMKVFEFLKPYVGRVTIAQYDETEDSWAVHVDEKIGARWHSVEQHPNLQRNAAAILAHAFVVHPPL